MGHSCTTPSTMLVFWRALLAGRQRCRYTGSRTNPYMCAPHTARQMAEISRRTGKAGRPAGVYADGQIRTQRQVEQEQLGHMQEDRKTRWAERSPRGWKMEQRS